MTKPNSKNKSASITKDDDDFIVTVQDASEVNLGCAEILFYGPWSSDYV